MATGPITPSSASWRAMYASAVESEPPDTISSTGESAFAKPRRAMVSRAAAITSLACWPEAACAAPSECTDCQADDEAADRPAPSQQPVEVAAKSALRSPDVSLPRGCFGAAPDCPMAASRAAPAFCSFVMFPTYLYTRCRRRRYARSMCAMVSMWSVCGNMSTGCTTRTSKPNWRRNARSRTCVSGLHEM